MTNVGIFGASGYTGFETLKIIRNHPGMTLKFATSESSAGQLLSELYPVPWQIPLVSIDTADLGDVDAVFCAFAECVEA